ncbi:hypothetical protein TRIUR3_08735 [Triticum urartu]|uniref:Uncharacterized protein n=1 Tax=Triticum urartu TaxID=4572 RepID=M7YTY2_TRIUA|nr:hypothetical protein TRIUR3_08735 [Triticum urartu]
MHHAAPLEGRLSDAAAKAVNELLSSGAAGNLSSLCSWADKGDCKDEEGVKVHFVVGAINNYTSQLLT